MRLRPFTQVDDLPFSARRADVELKLGPPRRSQTNGVGLIELDYGATVVRLQASTGRLEEVTKRTPILYLVTVAGVVDLPFGAIDAFVRSHDGQSFERAGFVVSPRFGLAFVPREPDWVTALAAHCIATWRQLGRTGQWRPSGPGRLQ